MLDTFSCRLFLTNVIMDAVSATKFLRMLLMCDYITRMLFLCNVQVTAAACVILNCL